jgi:hypothetical protein
VDRGGEACTYFADHTGEASYFNYETEDGKIIEDVAWCVNRDPTHFVCSCLHTSSHHVSTRPGVFRLHHTHVVLGISADSSPPSPFLLRSSINERKLR